MRSSIMLFFQIKTEKETKKKKNAFQWKGQSGRITIPLKLTVAILSGLLNGFGERTVK